MRPYLVIALLSTLACLHAGCASEQTSADDNPYHLQQNTVTTYGEASVFYGHSAGH